MHAYAPESDEELHGCVQYLVDRRYGRTAGLQLKLEGASAVRCAERHGWGCLQTGEQISRRPSRSGETTDSSGRSGRVDGELSAEGIFGAKAVTPFAADRRERLAHVLRPTHPIP